MLRRIMLRLAQVVPTVLIATLLVFSLVELMPGDPAYQMAGEFPSPERVAQIRKEYGFDRPFLERYATWLGDVLQGDFSKSIHSRVPVLESIANQFPYTLTVVIGALLWAFVLGVPLGVFAAIKVRTRLDGFVSALSSIGIAMPPFWFGMLLITVFSLKLQWLPATGAAYITTDPGAAILHALMPTFALGMAGVAEVARQTRSAMLEVLSAPFIRTLRAKGLSPTMVLWKHGLKNILVNLITVFGLLVNRMLSTTVIVEAVFAIPGVGTLIVNAAIGKDFPIVQGVVLFLVVIVILVNSVLDLMYAVIDPRQRT